MIRELKSNWGGWLFLLFMFVVAPAFSISENITHPYPEVAKEWRLDGGSVCRRFYGSDSITCTR